MRPLLNCIVLHTDSSVLQLRGDVFYANHEGHHSISDRLREPILIVLYISFYFVRLQFYL